MNWSLDISPSAAEYYEAMIAAGRRLYRGKAQVLIMVYTAFVCFLAPIGATMLFWIIVSLLGGPPFGDLPAYAIPVTLVIFMMLAFWLMGQVYWIMARACTRSAFGHRYQLELGEAGMILTTAHSRWETRWGDMEAVAESKNTVILCISGIVIVVPRRVFLGPADAQEALRSMRRWLEAAR